MLSNWVNDTLAKANKSVQLKTKSLKQHFPRQVSRLHGKWNWTATQLLYIHVAPKKKNWKISETQQLHSLIRFRFVWLDFGLAKSDESEDKVGLLMAGAAPDQEISGIQEIRRSGRDSCQLELEKLPSSGILRMPAYRSLDRCVSLGELCKRWPSYLWTRKLRSGVLEKTLD